MIDLLIKRELTRTIGTLNNELLEEIDGSMEGIFGTDGEWREVGVFDGLTRTVGRVANRVFVGENPLSWQSLHQISNSYLQVKNYVRNVHPRRRPSATNLPQAPIWTLSWPERTLRATSPSAATSSTSSPSS